MAPNQKTERPGDGQKAGQFGWKPSFRDIFFKKISNAIIKVLRLNDNNNFSNIFIQTLDPVAKVKWGENGSADTIYFRTGHGRLAWRANTFHTEEPAMVEWIKTFKSDDVFLDIGANVGIYTVAAATLARKCYACELDPMNVSILKENLILNRQTDKVIVFPFPGIDTTEVVSVYYRDFSKGDALQSIGRETPLNTLKGLEHTMHQLGFPLDEIFERCNLERPNKVKIDVDGNEKKLFAGAQNIIFGAEEVYFEDSGLAECEPLVEEFSKRGFTCIRKEVPLRGALGSNLLFRRTKP